MGIIHPEAFHVVKEEFTLGSDMLAEVAASFQKEMAQGLSGTGKSSLRMLKSYIGLPTGKETGEYLALDFGGTNVRVLRILLEGNGRYQILKKAAKPLRVEGRYDCVGAGSTAGQLFDFLASLIDEAVDGNRSDTVLLGHTFSFPSSQTSLRDARLISWTKEFAVSGVEGRFVNELLRRALVCRNIRNVRPVAVINDTVAVLLSAAYRRGNTCIGSIYATGHNTCYLEADHCDVPMILNLESGNFAKVPQNRFDCWLDARSEKPGEQLLEKMVAGRYIGDIFGVALAELLGEPGGFYPFTSVDISGIIAEGTDSLDRAAEILNANTDKAFGREDAAMARELAASVVVRSARLVGACFAGILRHMGKDGTTHQHIAVDGSVYEKMPLAKENIQAAICELLGAAGNTVDTVLESGGSGIGAAIAAAMAYAETENFQMQAGDKF